ncbi:hypothetical protein ES705_47832 [subsurface metagenome]
MDVKENLLCKSNMFGKCRKLGTGWVFVSPLNFARKLKSAEETICHLS